MHWPLRVACAASRSKSRFHIVIDKYCIVTGDRKDSLGCGLCAVCTVCAVWVCATASVCARCAPTAVCAVCPGVPVRPVR